MKHTILFLAANPSGTDRRALDREGRAIQAELERSGFRDRFALETRWAAEPLDLLRELRKLKPTVVHFSGHGSCDGARVRGSATGQHRAIGVQDEPAIPGQHGLYFQGRDGRPQLVSAEALAHVFDAAGSSVKLVVLSACYSEPQAAALLPHVECVVGMRGSIHDDAARSFAIGFYGGLGERESVETAYKQGCAAIDLEGLSEGDRPQLESRQGVDAAQLVLASTLRASRPNLVGPPRRGVARLERSFAEPVMRSKAKRPSMPRAAALGIATAIVVAAGIYVGIPRHPILRVDSILEKYILTADPHLLDSPQVVRVVIKPIVDGRQGDDCFAQASENMSFTGPPGNELEPSGVFEDHYGCEQNEWNLMIQLAKRPHIEVWHGWVRVALRRGNRIFESKPVAVDVTKTAETLVPAHRSATR
jgi:CHAT domain